MPPFLYPKTTHIRRQSPPGWKTYSRYKPILREEFEKKCVYCRLPDTLRGQDNFGVDHYRPKKDFPHLIAEYSNLFYACNGCNRRKGTFWPDSNQLAAGQFIPNPCDHIMFGHLRYRGIEVIEHSATGKFAKDILILNDDISIKHRRHVLDIIEMLKEKIPKVEKTIIRIGKQIQQSTDNAVKSNLEKEKEEHEQKLERLKELYKELSGD